MSGVWPALNSVPSVLRRHRSSCPCSARRRRNFYAATGVRPCSASDRSAGPFGLHRRRASLPRLMRSAMLATSSNSPVATSMTSS